MIALGLLPLADPSYIAKRVEITGTVRKDKKKEFLRVDALRVFETSRRR